MLRGSIKLLGKLSVNNNICAHLNRISSVRYCVTNLQNEISKLPISEDADNFGTLTKSLEVDEIIDEGDKAEDNFLENVKANAEKLRTSQYAKMIKECLSKRKIQEAINVLEVRMIKKDCVKPANYIYNLLIGGCGRVGYTKKAFNLFNDMKKRGLQPTGGTYTALFNACSNSPWVEDGLSRAKKLRLLMYEKSFQPNNTTYNAMIKAFGHCGDIKTAFSIVDEMTRNDVPIKTENINFLLHSCISNKEAGFLQALCVWRKFKEFKLVPDIYSFNLLLHCIRDCQLGDSEVARNLLGSPAQNEVYQITGDNSLEVKETKTDDIPNLLADVPHLGKTCN